jgi:iron complex outermembrane receptor protein
MAYKVFYCISLVFIFCASVILPQDEIKTYTLDETVVTGTRLSLNKGRLPLSITVISNSEIVNSTNTNILPLLNNYVPGLFLNSRNVIGYGIGSGASGQMSMRGMGSSPTTGLLVLIDGQAQYMGIFGHPINDTYLTSDVDKIEVIRGPASLLYGSNALGGAINIITKRRKDNGFGFNSLLSYGSFNTNEISGNGGFKSNGFDVTASYNHFQTDGHRKDGNDSYRNNSFYSQAEYSLSQNYSFSLNGSITDACIYDPGTETSPALNNYYNYTRARTAFSFENHFSSAEGALRVYYNYGKHDIYDGWHSTDDMKGIALYQSMKFSGENIITAGVEYKNYGGKGENKNMPLQAQLNNGLMKDLSIKETEAYSILQLNPVKNLFASAGVRYTNNSEYGNEITPQFGLSYLINDVTTIKANAAKAFRSPTIADLFLFQVSNSALEPERVWSYEIGLSRYFFNNEIKTELTLFYLDAENMIQTIPSGTGVKKMNTGKFNNKGVEFALNFFPGRQLSGNVNYSYVKTGTQLKYSPEHKLNFHLEYIYGILSVSSDVQTISGLYVSKVLSQNYTTLDLSANLSVTRSISVYAKGLNLTDKKYYIDEGYPSPGITLLTGIKLSL